MCGTVVWKNSLTSRRPRGSAVNPAAPRSSRSVLHWRPTAWTRASAWTTLPLSRWATTRPLSSRRTPATFSPSRKVVPWDRIWYERASTISSSMKSRRVGRCSISVTGTLSAENIEASSRPMTPAPTTIRVLGISVQRIVSSTTTIFSPSKGMSGWRTGRVPQAISTWPAVRVCVPEGPSTSRVCGSLNRAVPLLPSHHRHLALDDGEHAALEVRDRDATLDGVVGPVERPLAEASQVEDGLAKCLTRDGAAVESDAADRLLAVDDGDVLAELRGGDGALLPGGAAPDHDQIIV